MTEFALLAICVWALLALEIVGLTALIWSISLNFYWGKPLAHNQKLADQRIYHYVRKPYAVKQDQNGTVVLQPHIAIRNNGKNSFWSNVASKHWRQPAKFFFVGRNTKGGKVNFRKKDLEAAATLVVIEGKDFLKFHGSNRLYWRRPDRTIASFHGYQGPAKVLHISNLGSDRQQPSDDHLNLEHR